MTMDDVMERLSSDSEARNKWVGVYIGILAVLLAVCAVGGENAAKDATRTNIEASNTWAFFQAKISGDNLKVTIDELEIRLTEPGLSPATREAITKKIAEYKATVQRLTSEPDKQEGLDELFVKGKALEAERDVALRKDPTSTGASSPPDCDRARLGALDYRQHATAGHERRPGRTGDPAFAQRLHPHYEPYRSWVEYERQEFCNWHTEIITFPDAPSL